MATTLKRKICIFGVHHNYQYCVLRPMYLQRLKSLIRLHSVDLVAEEAGTLSTTYAREAVKEESKASTRWVNVETEEEYKRAPNNGCDTLIDFEFHDARERVWIETTSRAMKESALLICGYVHTLSVAGKFRSRGFEVEVHSYIDALDLPK